MYQQSYEHSEDDVCLVKLWPYSRSSPNLWQNSILGGWLNVVRREHSKAVYLAVACRLSGDVKLVEHDDALTPWKDDTDVAQGAPEENREDCERFWQNGYAESDTLMVCRFAGTGCLAVFDTVGALIRHEDEMHRITQCSQSGSCSVSNTHQSSQRRE